MMVPADRMRHPGGDVSLSATSKVCFTIGPPAFMTNSRVPLTPTRSPVAILYGRRFLWVSSNCCPMLWWRHRSSTAGVHEHSNALRSHWAPVNCEQFLLTRVEEDEHPVVVRIVPDQAILRLHGWLCCASSLILSVGLSTVHSQCVAGLTVPARSGWMTPAPAYGAVAVDLVRRATLSWSGRLCRLTLPHITVLAAAAFALLALRVLAVALRALATELALLVVLAFALAFAMALLECVEALRQGIDVHWRRWRHRRPST